MSFLHFGFSDALDIILVALVFYFSYTFFKGSSALRIFIAFGIIYILYILSRTFSLHLFSSLLNRFIDVGVIAWIVVFQQEIRRFLIHLGSQNIWDKNAWKSILKWNTQEPVQRLQHTISIISDALIQLSNQKTCALIVLKRQTDLAEFEETGLVFQCTLSPLILETVFYKNAPFHDGALILHGMHCIAARCILPMTERTDLSEQTGTRHRAAAGITERTDAIALVVSEQNGDISAFLAGKRELFNSAVAISEFLKLHWK
ncbi:MAG: diadenylate cyclase [Bacteroidia bacterium]